MSATCRLVGLDGLEPSTSRLSGARSSHLSYKPFSLIGFDSIILLPCFDLALALLLFKLLQDQLIGVWSFAFPRHFPDYWVSVLPTGGDDGNRTHDPLLAGQVLSQLSYTPMFPGLLLFFFKDLTSFACFWSLKIEQQKFRTSHMPKRSRQSTLRDLREKISWSP